MIFRSFHKPKSIPNVNRGLCQMAFCLCVCVRLYVCWALEIVPILCGRIGPGAIAQQKRDDCMIRARQAIRAMFEENGVSVSRAGRPSTLISSSLPSRCSYGLMKTRLPKESDLISRSSRQKGLVTLDRSLSLAVSSVYFFLAHHHKLISFRSDTSSVNSSLLTCPIRVPFI